MTHDWSRREIGRIAAAMLAGDVSFIEGARELASLRFDAGLERDPDLTVFVGIDSETDALPMGEVRRLWNAEALAKLQAEIDHAEAWARNAGIDECKRLVERFGKP